MLGPFQRWNFLWVPNTYFVDESNSKVIKTAVDSDGYDGADFNSVCYKYSQSLGTFF